MRTVHTATRKQTERPSFKITKVRVLNGCGDAHLVENNDGSRITSATGGKMTNLFNLHPHSRPGRSVDALDLLHFVADATRDWTTESSDDIPEWLHNAIEQKISELYEHVVDSGYAAHTVDALKWVLSLRKNALVCVKRRNARSIWR